MLHVQQANSESLHINLSYPLYNQPCRENGGEGAYGKLIMPDSIMGFYSFFAGLNQNTHMHTHVYTNTHTCTQTRTNTHVCAYTHTFAYTRRYYGPLTLPALQDFAATKLLKLPAIQSVSAATLVSHSGGGGGG